MWNILQFSNTFYFSAFLIAITNLAYITQQHSYFVSRIKIKSFVKFSFVNEYRIRANIKCPEHIENAHSIGLIVYSEFFKYWMCLHIYDTDCTCVECDALTLHATQRARIYYTIVLNMCLVRLHPLCRISDNFMIRISCLYKRGY